MIINPTDGDCATCGERIYFPRGGGMMPPLIGDYFVCEACYQTYTSSGPDALIRRADDCGIELHFEQRPDVPT